MRILSDQYGYKVVNTYTGKTMYRSTFKIDCEQYIFAYYQRKQGN